MLKLGLIQVTLEGDLNTLLSSRAKDRDTYTGATLKDALSKSDPRVTGVLVQVESRRRGGILLNVEHDLIIHLTGCVEGRPVMVSSTITVPANRRELFTFIPQYVFDPETKQLYLAWHLDISHGHLSETELNSALDLSTSGKWKLWTMMCGQALGLSTAEPLQLHYPIALVPGPIFPLPANEVRQVAYVEDILFQSQRVLDEVGRLSTERPEAGSVQIVDRPQVEPRPDQFMLTRRRRRGPTGKSGSEQVSEAEAGSSTGS